MSMEKEARELYEMSRGYGDPYVEKISAYLTKLVAEAKAEAYEDAAAFQKQWVVGKEVEVACSLCREKGFPTRQGFGKPGEKFDESWAGWFHGEPTYDTRCERGYFHDKAAALRRDK